MSESPKSRSSKPGRKLRPELELTPNRIAQRAFRARRTEKIEFLENRVRELEAENAALTLAPSFPSPPIPAVPIDLLSSLPFLTDSDRLFLNHHCQFSFSHLTSPSSPSTISYIHFLLSLSHHLPLTSLGPSQLISKPLPLELQEAQALLDKECCFGMIDCSQPAIQDPSRPVRPFEYLGSQVAWGYFNIFREALVDPEMVARRIAEFRMEGVYGGTIRCEKEGGVRVAKEAVMALREEILRSTTE